MLLVLISATAAAGVTFPQVVPIGQIGSPTAFRSDIAGGDVVGNQGSFLVELGTNAIGGNNDVMEWRAELALLA